MVSESGEISACLVCTSAWVSCKWQGYISLEKGLENVDAHTQILAPNQSFSQPGVLFWAERSVLLKHAQVWVNMCLAPISALFAPWNWVAKGQIPQSRGSWRAALWPPEAQGQPAPKGSSISVLQGVRSAFAGQVLDQLYLLSTLVVRRLWLAHAALLPPKGPCMALLEVFDSPPSEDPIPAHTMCWKPTSC